MHRDRALKVVLVVVGLLFVATIYPVVTIVVSHWQPHGEDALPDVVAANEAMILSVYATLGVFLLLAARDPAAHRSVIAFAAWSSLAHGALMAVLSIQLRTERAELLASAVALGIVGTLLIALAPGKRLPAPTAAA